MSTTVHNAIVITTWNREITYEIQNKIKGLGLNVSEIIESIINGYQTILVAPDGSKDGWEQDLFGDKVRQEIIDILNSYAYEDGSTPIEWVDVAYGNDFQRDKIEAMMKAPDIQENQIELYAIRDKASGKYLGVELNSDDSSHAPETSVKLTGLSGAVTACHIEEIKILKDLHGSYISTGVFADFEVIKLSITATPIKEG